MDYEIRPATEDDVRAMAPRLRAKDRAEVEALGYDVLDGLMDSFHRALWAKVALCRGRVICMWGVGAGSLLGGIGHPWMLGTPLLDRDPRALLRESRREVAGMLTLFDQLDGLVDARYAGAVRWLGWLGFEMAETVMVNGVPFHFYRLRRK